MMRIAVVIVAAGRGQRFGQTGAKQYQLLDDRSVIYHAIKAFQTHPAVDDIQPVIHPDDEAAFATAIMELPTLPPVFGGATRQQSVLAGLKALSAVEPDFVLVHDAARPAVPAGVIDRVIAALDTADGAVPGLRVVDTLKFTNANDRIIETRSRDGLWRAQTPQGFRYSLLNHAHEASQHSEHTDDAAVMEACGHHVVMVQGAVENRKITVREDLEKMRTEMNSTQDVSGPGIRIGNGFDVHRIGPGDGMTLCGVPIAGALSLIGHSDADVALHALTDAILGASGNGDIGSHFPPSDDQWRGAASDRFLRHAVDAAKERGYVIGNLDLTIICERPKIGPHREAMRHSIAEICEIDVSQASVKATTTEALGFTGRGEGIAAQASVVLYATK